MQRFKPFQDYGESPHYTAYVFDDLFGIWLYPLVFGYIPKARRWTDQDSFLRARKPKTRFIAPKYTRSYKVLLGYKMVRISILCGTLP